MIDRSELHRQLDALLDEIEARDARNDDAGRLAWVNGVVPRIGDFLVAAGFDRPAKHLFAAEAAEALGAPAAELDARSLIGEGVRIPGEAARAAHQRALARLVYLLLGRLMPSGYALLLVQSLLSASVGEVPGVLVASEPRNRQSKAAGQEATLVRRMVLRAAHDAALESRLFEEVLAEGACVSVETARKMKKAASPADRAAARALGIATRKGLVPSPEAEAIKAHIGWWDWPTMRAKREEFRKGNLWPEAGGV